MTDTFRRLSRSVADAVGRPTAFFAALLSILIWAAAGPMFGWSESWQLVVNTGTTVLTWLMLFLLQATQNRDTRELQLKLDELLDKLEGPRGELAAAEELSDEEIDREAQAIRERAS